MPRLMRGTVCGCAVLTATLAFEIGMWAHTTPASASCVTGAERLSTVTGVITREDVVDARLDTVTRFFALVAEPDGHQVTIALFGRAGTQQVEDAY